jgi:hypothetical protein
MEYQSRDIDIEELRGEQSEKNKYISTGIAEGSNCAN